MSDQSSARLDQWREYSTRELYQATRHMEVLGAVAAAVPVAVFWDSVPHHVAIAWISCMLAVEVGIALLGWSYSRAPSRFAARTWFGMFAVLYFAVSVGWGLSAPLFFGSLDEFQQLFLAIFLTAVIAICLWPYSWSFSLYAIGTILMIFPVVLELAVRESSSPGERFIAVLIASVAAFLVRTSYVTYSRRREAYNSRFELKRAGEVVADQKRQIDDAQNQIDHLNRFDEQTQVSRLEHFHEFMRRQLTDARTEGHFVSVLNLNRFHAVKDGFGAQAADLVLRTVAERLVALAGTPDAVARAGLDEFVVYLPVSQSMESSSQVANALMSALALPVPYDGARIEINAGIGIARHPDHGTASERLVDNAIFAMRAAKRDSVTGYREFHPDLEEGSRRRAAIERALGQAIEKSEFQLHYQPKLSLSDNTIVGAEALLRWESPTLGRVSPVQFVTVAEEIGLIRDIGNWVIFTATRSVADLRKHAPIHVAINASAEQFARGQIVPILQAAINQNSLDPASLQVEITESVFIGDARATAGVLAEIRSLGIKIALDDFGTGYSSLSYLSTMPVDYLKLDHSFIVPIPKDDRQTRLVAGVLQLANILGIEVVAEGVEEQEQLDWLRNNGCHYAQGYLIAKPMPEAEFARFLLSRVSNNGS